MQTRLLYPDPFKPAGVVLELKHDAMVTVSLTDGTGAIISMPLSHRHLRKGSHQIVVDLIRQDEQEVYLRIAAEMDGRTYSEVKRL